MIKKYFSIFSGIGGFEKGIQQAYDDLSKIKRLQQRMSQKNSPNIKQQFLAIKQPTCVGYSEIDPECERCKKAGREKYQPKTLITKTKIRCDTCGTEKEQPALQIYEKHFPSHTNFGDITKINEKELPDFDLLVAGVPCQSWSIAGKRGGFGDERGNMWFECFKILRAKQPKYFLFENVKGLLSHDRGKSMERICEELCECGYGIDFEVKNSKDYGVAQSRNRVFIVGIRMDLLNEMQIF